MNNAEASIAGVPSSEISDCGNNKFQFNPFCKPIKTTIETNKINVPEINNFVL